MFAKTIYTIQDNDLMLDVEEKEKEYILRVKDLPQEDKPREKLLRYGPDALSVSELLAIVLQVGTKKEEILLMSSRILKEYGEKGILNQKNPKELSSELSIPITKASQLIACFELGRRFFRKFPHGPVSIRSAKEVYEYVKDMRDLPKEQLRGLYLNGHYQIVHDEVISLGSMSANIVHPRDVFKPALEYSAAALIIIHNHPSGVAQASKADKDITRQLIEAGKILGVELLDHLIITEENFISILPTDN